MSEAWHESLPSEGRFDSSAGSGADALGHLDPEREHDLLEQAMELVKVGIWQWDVTSGYFWWSDLAGQIFGLASGGTTETGDAFFGAVHPEDRQKIKDRVAAALAGTGELDARHRVVHPNGDERHVHERAQVTYAEDGSAVAMMGTVLDVTEDTLVQDELSSAIAALEESEEQYRLLAENAYDVIWTMGLDGSVTYVSPSVERVRGFTPAEAMVQSLEQINTPDSLVKVQEYFGLLYAAMESGTQPPTFHGEVEYFRKDGSIMLGELQVVPQVDPSGQIVQILGVTRDISERKSFEDELRLAHDLARQSKERYRLLAENANDVVFRAGPDGIIDWTSEGIVAILGWTPDQVVGRDLEELIDLRDRGHAIAEVRASTPDRPAVVRMRMLTRSGGTRWIEARVRPVVDSDGVVINYVGGLREIDAEVRALRELERQARTDQLTGLLNRTEGLDRLGHTLSHPRRTGQLVAVAFCDLDDFKTVNDTHGHAVGDRLLQTATTRIRSCIRSDDLLIRVGGDEVLVVLNGVHDLDEAVSIAEKIRVTVSLPLRENDEEISTTISIGITLASTEGEDVDTLVARSDRAMYQAKHAGRNQVVAD